MINLLFFLAFITSVLSTTTTESGQCENYGEKLASIDLGTSLARNDPCFGYGYNCCTNVYSDVCYWKDTYNCNHCARNIGYGSCSACCDSYSDYWTTTTDEPTAKPTSKPTSKPTEEPTPAPVTDEPTPYPTVKPTKSPSDPTSEPTEKPTMKPTKSPSDPTTEPTEKPTSKPTAKPTEEPTPAPVTDEPTPMPTSKPTTKPTGEPTPSPVTSAPVTAAPVATPAPTVHSAKKWTMLHPDYEGGDGELLWNVYYGDYAEDPRFDDFRQQQLWDVEVIRPVIEEDVKYARFQLAHQVHTHKKSKVVSHQWLIVAAAAIVILAAFGMWMKQRASYKKLVDPSAEIQPLIQTYGNGYGN